MTICTANTADGQPCKNHAMKGAQLCKAQGGSALDIRHGAPLANTNSAKHGFYRPVFSEEAQLGVDFLALVETNRFKYWQEGHEFDDAWWYFAQANHCTYARDPGRPLETHLHWFVPATTKITTPTGTQPLHDDRLISAAQIAEADKLLRDGRLLLGRAESIISASYDPLVEPPGDYYDPLEDLPDW